MPRFTFTREFYIPKGSVRVADKLSDAVAYIKAFAGRDGKTRYEAAIFFGKQAKPVAHYTYRTEAERERSVREHFERRQQHAALMSSRREAAKSFTHTAKVGDIWHTSWGYDQTNVEFFEIVEIRGKYAVLRELCAAVETAGHASAENCVPQSGQYVEPRSEDDDRGRPIRRLIQDGHITIDKVRTAWPWGKREPITGTVIGRPMHQTAFGWGH